MTLTTRPSLKSNAAGAADVVDIDECAPGGIASTCNSTVGGNCVGQLPDRKFHCTCQPGYELDHTGVSCKGPNCLSRSDYKTHELCCRDGVMKR